MGFSSCIIYLYGSEIWLIMISFAGKESESQISQPPSQQISNLSFKIKRPLDKANDKMVWAPSSSGISPWKRPINLQHTSLFPRWHKHQDLEAKLYNRHKNPHIEDYFKYSPFWEQIVFLPQEGYGMRLLWSWSWIQWSSFLGMSLY